jgi:hypothetical protein
MKGYVSRILPVLVALALVGGTAGLSLAGQAPAEVGFGDASIPFGAGERAEYQVKLGAIRVGSGSMEILGIEDVHGYPTYHASLRLSRGSMTSSTRGSTSKDSSPVVSSRT